MAVHPRVALVTGGAKRVGRAICLKFAGLGYDVAFTYLTSAVDADALVAEIQGNGRDALAIQADLAHPDAATTAIDSAFSAWSGRLDVLVNNASVWLPARLGATDLSLVRKLNAVHVESPLLLAQTFADRLRVSGGSIVNMLDLLAERPWPEYLAYCASKSALWNLTLGLARELAPKVTVNGIAPGVVEWPDGFPDAEKEKYLRRVPLARSGTPDDVAEAVAYLVGAGSYLTGQVLRLDGGRSIV